MNTIEATCAECGNNAFGHVAVGDMIGPDKPGHLDESALICWPCASQIALLLYYDEDDNYADGNGWNIPTGAYAFRFPTKEMAIKFCEQHGDTYMLLDDPKGFNEWSI